MGSSCHEQKKHFGNPEFASHACAVYSEWLALQHRLRSHANHVSVNGRDLTIADVVAVSLHGVSADISDDQQLHKLINDSVEFLEKELEAGRVIYGVNTGFGGSANTRTQHFERLQSAAIQHLNVGILLEADRTSDSSLGITSKNPLLRSHALPSPVVKAAMLIRCNSLVRGHSGVRLQVIESIMHLLARDLVPVVPLRGSISASGDLSTLSYIAGVIEGNPNIFVRTEGGKTVLRANEALKIHQLAPIRLQAKEGLGITNGTAPSCAAACLVMHEANRLALLVQLLTAMATEALSGTAHNYDPFISEVRPHAGQAEAAANILRFLSGSQLSPYSSSYATAQKRIGLAQDRYALRTAPQWIGPQLEDLALATRQVATELNATTDNPLIDVAGSTIHHGGNFQAMALTSAMDKTLAALQNLGRLLFAQASEMINNTTSHGLPPNLAADDPSASFTAKGFDVNMAAYAAELAYLARGPVSACMQPAEMANQSVNSMALVAARYAAEAVEVLSLMAATYIWILCQALDLRCLRVEFGRAVEREVSRVIRLSLLADLTFVDLVKDSVRYDEFLRFVTEVTEAVLQRWDQLSHLDLRDRSKTAANESLGPVLECIAKYRDTVGDLRLEKIPDYQKLMAEMLEKRYNDIRAQFFRGQLTAATYISPASRVVFAWVRKDLKIPFHRGLEDHPTLLLRKAEGARACNGDGVQDDGANGVVRPDEELLARGRTLGTMASDIYEAMRRGELHDRIMKFGEDAGLWR